MKNTPWALDEEAGYRCSPFAAGMVVATVVVIGALVIVGSLVLAVILFLI